MNKYQSVNFIILGIVLTIFVACGSSRETVSTEPEFADILEVSATPDSQLTGKAEQLEKKKVNVLEMKTRIQVLQDELTRMRDEAERLKEENKQLQSRIRKEYSEGSIPVNHDRRPTQIDSLSDTYRELLITRNQQAMENAAIAAEIARTDSQISGANDLTGLLGPISDEEYQDRYDSALNQYFSGNYYRAIAELQTLLLIDKTNEFADNAQYWIAESYYSMEQYGKAAEEFMKVLAFPKTNKADHAQFKSALCQLKMGNLRRARREFETLREEYPESELIPKVTEYMNESVPQVQ